MFDSIMSVFRILRHIANVILIKNPILLSRFENALLTFCHVCSRVKTSQPEERILMKSGIREH
jgi:hypothetical protein